MKVTLKTIKRLVETGAARDVSHAENYRRPTNSTIIYYSVGECGVTGAALIEHGTGEITVVIGRTSNLLLMIN